MMHHNYGPALKYIKKVMELRNAPVVKPVFDMAGFDRQASLRRHIVNKERAEEWRRNKIF